MVAAARAVLPGQEAAAVISMAGGLLFSGDVVAAAGDLTPAHISRGAVVDHRRLLEGPARGGWRSSAGVPAVACASWRNFTRSIHMRGRVMRLPVKSAPAPAMAGDGGVFDVVFFSGHRHCSPCHLAQSAPGETLDLGLIPDRMMAVPFGVVPFLRASFWSRCWLEGF